MNQKTFIVKLMLFICLSRGLGNCGNDPVLLPESECPFPKLVNEHQQTVTEEVYAKTSLEVELKLNGLRTQLLSGEFKPAHALEFGHKTQTSQIQKLNIDSTFSAQYNSRRNNVCGLWETYRLMPTEEYQRRFNAALEDLETFMVDYRSHPETRKIYPKMEEIQKITGVLATCRQQLNTMDQADPDIRSLQQKLTYLIIKIGDLNRDPPFSENDRRIIENILVGWLEFQSSWEHQIQVALGHLSS